MKPSKIYILEIESSLELAGIKPSQKSISYFTNLNKLITTLKNVLLVQEWDIDTLNYMAVYRSLKLKGRYNLVIRQQKVAFLNLKISQDILNPDRSNLGIFKAP